jgi:hypothetical protein
MVRSRACLSDDELIWKSELPPFATSTPSDKKRTGKRSRESDDATSIATAVSEIAGHDQPVSKSAYPGLGAMMDNERERLRCATRVSSYLAQV